jgi:hypothetical protein
LSTVTDLTEEEMAHRSKTQDKGGKQDPALAAGATPDADALRREIELRAYHRYCERGCAAGADADDWVGAEREVLAAHGHSGVSDGKA